MGLALRASCSKETLSRWGKSLGVKFDSPTSPAVLLLTAAAGGLFLKLITHRSLLRHVVSYRCTDPAVSKSREESSSHDDVFLKVPGFKLKASSP